MIEMITNCKAEFLRDYDVKQLFQFYRSKIILVEYEHNEGISSKLTIEKDMDDKIHFRKTILGSGKINQTKQLLNKYRNKVDFLVVQPNNAQNAALAARDGRVDAVRLSDESTIKIFNTRYGRRIAEHEKIIELDLGFMFSHSRAIAWRRIHKIIQSMKKCNLHYILTATEGQKTTFHSYRGLKAIARVLGLDNSEINESFIVERLKINNQKRNNKFPFAGVEVVNGS